MNQRTSESGSRHFTPMFLHGAGVTGRLVPRVRGPGRDRRKRNRVVQVNPKTRGSLHEIGDGSGVSRSGPGDHRDVNC